MLCRMIPRKRKTGKVPVYLNVYDLTPINGYAYWLGLGVYHSGVQVHGVEYGFGAHDRPTTGIFEVEPRKCPGFAFRKSILIGSTDMCDKDVHAFMKFLAEEYSGNTYNLITKNCNHFCNHACLHLSGKPIPSWVNRLARLGFLCNCVLPAVLNEAKVQHITPEDKAFQKKKPSRFVSSSLSSCSSSALTRGSRQRSHLAQSSSLIKSSSLLPEKKKLE